MALKQASADVAFLLLNKHISASPANDITAKNGKWIETGEETGKGKQSDHFKKTNTYSEIWYLPSPELSYTISTKLPRNLFVIL